MVLKHAGNHQSHVEVFHQRYLQHQMVQFFGELVLATFISMAGCHRNLNGFLGNFYCGNQPMENNLEVDLSIRGLIVPKKTTQPLKDLAPKLA